MAADTRLPEEFADLEPFAGVWVLPTVNERCERRMASSMDEMQAFYDAVVARGDEIFAYLDQFALDEMPDEAVHLLWLMCALSVVSFSVDVFKQPKVPDSGDGILPVVLEPSP